MSSEIQPIATSTPNSEAVKSSVLQEKQLNKDSRRRPLQKKINFSPRKSSDKVKSKENVSHPNPKSRSSGVAPTRRRSEGDDKREAHRRQQALEAMQILEQRRQRMSQQNLAEELEELSLVAPTETRDALMEKKRMEAKRLKEKRIRAHLAEQEANKKFKEPESDVHRIQSQSRSVIPRPLYPTFPNYRQRNRVVFKPKPFIMPRLSEEDEMEPKMHQIPRRRPPFLLPPPQRVFIRYSKDDLRALNPYGYYFM